MTSDFNQGDGGVRNGLVASGSIRGFQMYKSSNVPATTNATGQCFSRTYVFYSNCSVNPKH